MKKEGHVFNFFPLKNDCSASTRRCRWAHWFIRRRIGGRVVQFLLNMDWFEHDQVSMNCGERWYSRAYDAVKACCVFCKRSSSVPEVVSRLMRASQRVMGNCNRLLWGMMVEKVEIAKHMSCSEVLIADGVVSKSQEAGKGGEGVENAFVTLSSMTPIDIFEILIEDLS